MKPEWKTKALLILLAVVGSLYVLVPTALHFDTQRAALTAANQPLPWYFSLFPKKQLKLGLDLQGGIYVEMVVALDDAIKRKTDVLLKEVARELETEKHAPASVLQTKPGVVTVTFAKADDLNALTPVLNRYYRDTLLQTATDDPLAVQLALSPKYREQLTTNVVAQATESVRNRINRYGVGEPDIRRQGADRIAIELPGLTDPDRALDLIKRTGQLELRMVHNVASGDALQSQQADIALKIAEARKTLNLPDSAYTADATAKINAALAGKIPDGTEVAFELIRNEKDGTILRGIPYLLNKTVDITGDMLDDARVTVIDNQPKVAFAFNSSGTKLFADLTRKHVGHFMAIVLDGNVMSAPSIREPITQGHGVIELGRGNFDVQQKEANDLALILQEGALPASLNEVEGKKTVIGPSLGRELINQGFHATWTATLGVMVFMLFYYRRAGLIADVAVMLNVLFMLALLSMLDATLTLPGIAGIVLTVGMAVDANVIINERIREELRAGNHARTAVELGYAHAKRAIIDSNVTTLIAGIILYQFGTGTIKGFAVTLCIGIVTTLFSAVTITQAIYEYLVYGRKIQKLSI